VLAAQDLLGISVSPAKQLGLPYQEQNVERTAQWDNFGKLLIIHASPALLAALFVQGLQMDSAVGAQVVSLT
jgi:hypothetical protein